MSTTLITAGEKSEGLKELYEGVKELYEGVKELYARATQKGLYTDKNI